MTKLALLGAVRPGYETRAKEIFDKQKDSKTDKYCLTGWSYMIHPSKLKILDNQFNNDGFFRIYIHDIKNPEDGRYGFGTGFVKYRIDVKRYHYDEEPYLPREPEYITSIDKDKLHRLYTYFTDTPKEIIGRKWNTFLDYDAGIPLSGRFKWNLRDAEFGYIIDENI